MNTMREHRIEYFFVEIHAAEHCNLCCAGCTHFSPLAREEFCDVEQTGSTLSRLIQIAGNNCRAIHIMGGEPLLNPNLPELMNRIREAAGNNISIELVTNGLLLDVALDAFWDSCRKNHIIIRPTVYPIDVDYQKLASLADEKQVLFQTYSKPGETKTFKSFPLDLNGTQNNQNSFEECDLASKFLLLKQGYLYICSISANIEHFNRFFNLDLERSEQDRIDVFQLQSLEDLLDRINKPIPFCRYCNVSLRRNIGCWNKSQYKLEEWTSS